MLVTRSKPKILSMRFLKHPTLNTSSGSHVMTLTKLSVDPQWEVMSAAAENDIRILSMNRDRNYAYVRLFAKTMYQGTLNKSQFCVAGHWPCLPPPVRTSTHICFFLSIHLITRVLLSIHEKRRKKQLHQAWFFRRRLPC